MMSPGFAAGGRVKVTMALVVNRYPKLDCNWMLVVVTTLHLKVPGTLVRPAPLPAKPLAETVPAKVGLLFSRTTLVDNCELAMVPVMLVAETAPALAAVRATSATAALAARSA